MKITQLVTAEKLILPNKPPYVKPKYKTYHQLLQLGKPKKRLQQSSDSENDNFLEKLLKQEKNKNKKKLSKKTNSKPSAINKNNNQKTVRVSEATNQQKNQSNQQNVSEKRKTINSKHSEAQQKNIVDKFQIADKEIQHIMKSVYQRNKRFQEDGPLSERQSIQQEKQSINKKLFHQNPEILIDQSVVHQQKNSNNFYRTNFQQRSNFHSKTHYRNSNCFEQLKKQLNQYKKNRQVYNSSTKIKNGNIIHEITPHRKTKSFKALPLILHENINFKKFQIGRFPPKEQLFKSKQQEDNFIKSLRQVSKTAQSKY